MNNLKTKEGRKQAMDFMFNNSKTFNNKIVIIGFGAIGTALLPLLIKIVNIELNNVWVIEKDDFRFKNIIDGINKLHIKLLENNTKKILIDDIKLGQDDLIIDCSYEINTNYMFQLCSEYGISYTNSAVETWSNESKMKENEYTYFQRIKSLEDQNKLLQNKKNNFLISMGCNPGNVNIWTLYALDKINKKTKNYKYEQYAYLANKLGLKVLHISERDSQITNKPKRRNEYLNTWASNAISWYDEAFSFLEISWGTHEKTIPININKELSNEYQLILNGEGFNSYAYSYTPISKNLVGMLIRHEECYTIGKKLTMRNEKNEIVYKPSCYYVYKPCDSSIVSTYEVNDNLKKYQKNKRLMTSDIIEGYDELGCTMFFENGDIYWIGSLLDIEEARSIYNNEHNNIINATILKVVAGYIGAILYLIKCIKNKDYKGFLIPEDLPIKDIISITKPFLGPFGISKVEDWTVTTKPDNKWQFQDFTY